MKHSTALLCFFLPLFFVCALSSVVAQNTVSSQGQEVPSSPTASDWNGQDISTIVGPDGSLRTDGAAGGYSAKGWHMQLNPDGSPRFSRDQRNEANSRSVAAGNQWVGNSDFQVSGAPVYALAWHNGKLYVGGDFIYADGAGVHNIAAWDPELQQWSKLGNGLDGTVRAIMPYKGDLIVGGEFYSDTKASVSYLGRWDGAQWHSLGEGVNGTVYDLAIFQGDLIAGGNFYYVRDFVVFGLARWNGTFWQPIGDGVDGIVNALVATDEYLYVGGEFESVLQSAEDLTTNNIARWDGTAWSALGTGFSAPVYDLEYWNGNVYAGGDFFYNGERTATFNFIAVWNGSNWQPIGNGANFQVLSLHGTEDGLYAGGSFTEINGTNAEGVALWNGANWRIVDEVQGVVNAITSNGSDIFIGGMLSRVRDEQGLHVVRLGDGEPVRLGTTGLQGNNNSTGVEALAIIGDDVYVGGYFTWAGDIPAGFIARWNTTTGKWYSLGSGVNAQVSALTSSDGKLYAGGAFTRAGDLQSAHVAAWDPALSRWESMGTYHRSWVRSLAARNNTVYVGAFGAHQYANGQWSPLGTNFDFDGWVYALDFYDDNLVAGGFFYLNRNYNAGSIAIFKNNRWELLGNGVLGYVNALEPWRGKLMVGGSFDLSVNSAFTNLAEWDGNTLSMLPNDPIYGSVTTLTSNDSWLYVGGRFTIIDIGTEYLEANYVARWDGNAWDSLGGGLYWMPVVLASDESNLYAGGYFVNLVTSEWTGLAHWQSGPASVPFSGEARPLVFEYNPQQEQVRISLPTDSPQEYRLEVYDILGRHINSSHSATAGNNTNRFVLNVSGWSSGTYVLALIGSDGTVASGLLPVQ